MYIDGKTVKVMVPTYNAGTKFTQFMDALNSQQGLARADVLVIDSSSQDDTVRLAAAAGYKVKSIPRPEFRHGGTRAWAAENIDADIIVFLTQDVVLVGPKAIVTIVHRFEDEQVAAVFGRQLPNKDANIWAGLARNFNYPAQGQENILADKDKRGIKTAFFSDSFGAYRRAALLAVGNFPVEAQFGEDTIAAAKLLLAGYKTVYCAEAAVYHSHNLTLTGLFKRYRQTGRLHKEEGWLLEKFGHAEGEGLKFVQTEIRYLWEQGQGYLIPWALLRTGVKYLGYLWGKY